MKKPDFGKMLKVARVKKGLSQSEVAKILRLNSSQSVSDWERNYGSGVPLPALKKLIKLYGMSKSEVFESLLDYQYAKLQESLKKEFFGN